jgi:hypothetical protein
VEADWVFSSLDPSEKTLRPDSKKARTGINFRVNAVFMHKEGVSYGFPLKNQLKLPIKSE